MSAVHRVLERLDAVRQTSPGRWRARCAGHGGKSQSLAIADAEGRVLMHCFAGCETAAVLSAIGLTVSDLFDNNVGEHKPLQRSPWTARDVLDLVLLEAHVVGIVASDMLQNHTISEQDWRRLSQATGRLVGIANGVR